MMLLSSFLIILLFLFGYKKNKKVQSGVGNLLEVFVVFIRDEVVYPNMGEKQGRKFLPLILTFFFFIVVNNLLGLIISILNLDLNSKYAIFELGTNNFGEIKILSNSTKQKELQSKKTS